MTQSSLLRSALASLNDNSPTAVALDRVSKSFNGTLAVDEVSFTVPRGQSIVLVGPSGAGKTTLLRLMAGSVKPDEGTISVHARDLAEFSPGRELAELVGIVAQQYDLVSNLSVLQNVLAGRLGSWGLWRSLLSLIAPRDKPLAMQALTRVGMAERAYRRASQLSGGEQQRVAIARVLVQDPAVLLADEPVASLDPARSEDVMRLLTGIARESGKTLVASMHAVDLAARHFDRLLGVRNGAVQFDSTPADVTVEMLGALYQLEGLRA
jgi:phosphonate transport system ATP-binding protein